MTGVRAGFAVVLLAFAPAAAMCQDVAPSVDAALRQALERGWAAAVAAEGGLPDVADPNRGAAYTRILRRLNVGLVEPRDRRALLDERAGPIGEIDRKTAEESSALARSPASSAQALGAFGLAAKSGLIDFVTGALQSTGVSADGSAITVNLNAAGLFLSPQPEGQTAAKSYRSRGWLNNVGGTVTLGEKIPQKQITGFSGLPDPEKLLDAVAWDLRLRVHGDRDPRSPRWDDLLLGRLGPMGWQDAHLLTVPGVPADPALIGALQALRVPDVQRARRGISSSFQVTLSTFGTHVSNQPGTDRYGAALLVDKGFGPFDLTANVGYSRVQSVPAAGGVVDLKSWLVAAALSGTVLKGVLVADRGTEVTLSADARLPSSDNAAGADKRVWRADLALVFPVTGTTQAPISVTWTNDPNNLAKQKFVRGTVGFAYDFGALKRLAGIK